LPSYLNTVGINRKDCLSIGDSVRHWNGEEAEFYRIISYVVRFMGPGLHVMAQGSVENQGWVICVRHV